MPPFTGVAVKVTFSPVQILLPGLATIDTDVVAFEVIVKVMAFEVPVVVERHEASEVRTQVMASLFTSEDVVYVALVAPPIIVPFLYH